MKAKLHDTQKIVASDTHRFRVICAGRRWGKSVLSQLVVLKWALENKGTYWIVSPTYRQGKQIHWRGINQIIPRDWIAKKNEVELSITLKNGSVIELKGAENPDALRGVKLRGLVIDEIASIRNWDWLWQEVLRPTLTDYIAPVLFISTPKGFNHFYELFQRGQSDDVAFKSWRFTSYDNPYIKAEEIDNAKKELTEDTFYQEYMADFRKYTGLVYKEFNRETHVIDSFEIPNTWTMYRGFDFGNTNPTVCLWIAVDNDYNFFITDEYYDTAKPLDHIAGVVNANSYSSRVDQSYGDPSGAQWLQEFEWRGIFITKADKTTDTIQQTWVRYGIEKVSELLRTLPGRTQPFPVQVGQTGTGSYPKLFVFKNCTNTIREFETYRWKEKSVTQAQDLNEPDVPEKANDHAMDSLRYVVVSYRKPIDSVTNDFSVWKI